MTRLLFVLFFFSNVTFSKEGGDVGNGGDIILCDGQPAMVLDYFEARMGRITKPINLIDPSQFNEADFFRFVEKRLKNASLKFYQKFLKAKSKIGKVSKWQLMDKLPEVEDSNQNYLLPKACRLVQAAVRKKHEVFTSDKVLDYLSGYNFHQRYLLRLHEILGFLSDKRNKTKSLNVRVIVKELLRQDVDLKKLKKALRLIKSKKRDGFKNYYFNFVPFEGSFEIGHRFSMRGYCVDKSKGDSLDFTKEYWPENLLDLSVDYKDLSIKINMPAKGIHGVCVGGGTFRIKRGQVIPDSDLSKMCEIRLSDSRGDRDKTIHWMNIEFINKHDGKYSRILLNLDHKNICALSTPYLKGTGRW